MSKKASQALCQRQELCVRANKMFPAHASSTATTYQRVVYWHRNTKANHCYGGPLCSAVDLSGVSGRGGGDGGTGAAASQSREDKPVCVSSQTTCSLWQLLPFHARSFASIKNQPWWQRSAQLAGIRVPTWTTRTPLWMLTQVVQ